MVVDRIQLPTPSAKSIPNLNEYCENPRPFGSIITLKYPMHHWSPYLSWLVELKTLLNERQVPCETRLCNPAFFSHQQVAESAVTETYSERKGGTLDLCRHLHWARVVSEAVTQGETMSR